MNFPGLEVHHGQTPMSLADPDWNDEPVDAQRAGLQPRGDASLVKLHGRPCSPIVKRLTGVALCVTVGGHEASDKT